MITSAARQKTVPTVVAYFNMLQIQQMFFRTNFKQGRTDVVYCFFTWTMSSIFLPDF